MGYDQTGVQNATFLRSLFFGPNHLFAQPGRATRGHAAGHLLLAICCWLSAVSAQCLEATIFIPDSLGGLGMPNCLAYDPADNRVFVAGESTRTILVLDAHDGHRLARIPFEASVRALCYNSVSNKIYAAASDLDEVAVIDAGAMQLAGMVSAGDLPVALAYNPSLNRVYSVNLFSYDVTVIDGVGDTVIATVPVGMYPYAACWNPNRNVVYVANSNSNTVSVIDATADTVVATVPAGNAPMGFVYNPDLNKLYEADYGSGTVTVIDGLADSVLTTIAGGSSPIRLCYNPVDKKVYAGDEDVELMIIDCTADTLLNAGPGDAPYGVDVAYNALNDCVCTIYYDAFLVIDGATNQVISIQEFGGNYAQSICIADSGRRAFSTADEYNEVGVLDCEKDTLLTTAGTWAQLSALCLNVAADKVYCADSAANVVTVFNDETHAITAVIPVSQCPVALLYDSVGNKVYSAGAGDYYVSATLTVIDGAGDSVLKTIKMAEVYEPAQQALCLNSPNNHLYMTKRDPEGSRVVVLDAVSDTIIAKVPNGCDGDPDALCYNPALNYVYVATRGCVGVIDCEHNVLIAVDTVGYGPAGLCYVPVGARVFVASSGDSTVSVISGERPKVVARVSVGKQPNALCWDSMDNKVFCANRGDSSLAVIDASSYAVVARIVVGSEPVALSFDSFNDYVYCACRGSNEVYVIDAHRNNVLTHIGVGAEPFALAWNPVGLRTYVLNYGSSSVSVLCDSLHPGTQEGVLQASSHKPQATVIRGVLELAPPATSLKSQAASLLDITGRKVMKLHPGPNDIRRLAPGVYFLRYEQERRSIKIVVQR